jgi:hypothetical protein
MQTKRIYQVQHWPCGQWSREHNWCKVEAFSEKEAAEKVCGVALTRAGKLAQLRARVLTLGDRRQTRATPFYAALDQERTIARAIKNGVNYFDNPVQ